MKASLQESVFKYFPRRLSSWKWHPDLRGLPGPPKLAKEMGQRGSIHLRKEMPLSPDRDTSLLSGRGWVLSLLQNPCALWSVILTEDRLSESLQQDFRSHTSISSVTPARTPPPKLSLCSITTVLSRACWERKLFRCRLFLWHSRTNKDSLLWA